ncbi:hypothetical protein ACGFYA_29970, partial [Streptomyces sp. NPDC048305]
MSATTTAVLSLRSRALFALATVLAAVLAALGPCGSGVAVDVHRYPKLRGAGLVAVSQVADR